MAVIKRTFNLNVKPDTGMPLTALCAVIPQRNNRLLRKRGRKTDVNGDKALKTLCFASK